MFDCAKLCGEEEVKGEQVRIEIRTKEKTKLIVHPVIRLEPKKVDYIINLLGPIIKPMKLSGEKKKNSAGRICRQTVP